VGKYLGSEEPLNSFNKRIIVGQFVELFQCLNALKQRSQWDGVGGILKWIQVKNTLTAYLGEALAHHDSND